MSQRVYFVGTEAEVAHHAAPLEPVLDFEIIAAEEIVETAKAGDLAVFYSEHFDRFRNAIQQLKSKNIATLYMIDGILEWRNAWENRESEPACPFTMRPVLCHKVACIGQGQARILNDWGNAGKIEVVGIPRLDCLANLRKSETTQAKKRVLISTAKCPAFTSDQQRRLVESLTDLQQILTTRPDIEPVWRLTAKLDDELKIENRLNDLTGSELADILQGVDAVVTTPSTVALEAMVLEIPTAVLDYNPCPSYFQSAWQIKSPSHIQTVLDELLNPPATKMLFQNQQLKFELSCKGRSTARLRQLIKGMLEESRQCLGDKELNFAASLLAPASDEPIIFDHASLYSHFPEFSRNQTKELQLDLAHSRREIKHLQAELQQAHSELSQAHAIFDEINSHPIAGRIVKVRQKIVGFINKLRNRQSQPSTKQT